MPDQRSPAGPNAHKSPELAPQPAATHNDAHSTGHWIHAERGTGALSGSHNGDKAAQLEWV